MANECCKTLIELLVPNYVAEHLLCEFERNGIPDILQKWIIHN